MGLVGWDTAGWDTAGDEHHDPLLYQGKHSITAEMVKLS